MAVVKTIDHGLDRELRSVDALNRRGVKFGIQAGEATEPQSGADVLDIAIYNEFGTETIPPRPFMRDFAEKNESILNQAMERMAAAVQDGKIGAEAALDNVGQFAEKHQKAHVQKSKQWAKPNAPSTIDKKGSDVPLIDDAVMVNAIRYEKL